jgi:hypothetical protein
MLAPGEKDNSASKSHLVAGLSSNKNNNLSEDKLTLYCPIALTSTRGQQGSPLGKRAWH